MKILVLENDPREFTFLQQALNNTKFSLIKISSSEQAWVHLQSGEARFIIANLDTSDLSQSQFISRARAAGFNPPPYILVTTMNNPDTDMTNSGADDVIQRPFRAQELRNRIGMAERIISLSSSLSVARNQLEYQAVFY